MGRAVEGAVGVEAAAGGGSLGGGSRSAPRPKRPTPPRKHDAEGNGRPFLQGSDNDSERRAAARRAQRSSLQDLKDMTRRFCTAMHRLSVAAGFRKQSIVAPLPLQEQSIPSAEQAKLVRMRVPKPPPLLSRSRCDMSTCQRIAGLTIELG